MHSIYAYYAVIFGGLLLLRLFLPSYMLTYIVCWSITIAVELFCMWLARLATPFFARMTEDWANAVREDARARRALPLAQAI